ncbi:MAG TPA: hypothetical protein VLZ89_14320, partial [Anaerolineales bacterium]|nr:hypothetical protein [Anaerolineales bacterium]
MKNDAGPYRIRSMIDIGKRIAYGKDRDQGGQLEVKEGKNDRTPDRGFIPTIPLAKALKNKTPERHFLYEWS